METTGMVLLPVWFWPCAGGTEAHRSHGPAPASRTSRRGVGTVCGEILAADAVEGRFQIVGQLGADVDLGLRERMPEGEPGRMQELPGEAELPGAPVQRVAGDRQPDGGQVHADLVRPPGFQAYAQQRVPRQQLHHIEVRDRFTRGVGVEGLTQRVVAVAADRRVDRATSRAGTPDDESEVLP